MPLAVALLLPCNSAHAGRPGWFLWSFTAPCTPRVIAGSVPALAASRRTVATCVTIGAAAKCAGGHIVQFLPQRVVIVLHVTQARHDILQLYLAHLCCTVISASAAEPHAVQHAPGRRRGWPVPRTNPPVARGIL